jgi:ribosomal protein S18 acetylase RimI-like enzyme
MMREEDRRGLPRVVVRDMRVDDYDAVRRLWEEAGLPFKPEGRDSRQRVALELDQGTAVFLVADVDGEHAGVVFGTHDGRKGWINRLAVAPRFQGRGIARMLVREVETRLVAKGVEITAALIETPNTDSLAFFRAIGYVHDPDIEYVSKRRSADT